MLYITGDTHGDLDFHKLNSKHFDASNLTKDDYVLILGDVGVCWYGDKRDNYLQNWYAEKPWTTLWIDGNHENFDSLDKYPVEDWHGGKVQKINDSLIHLMRGEIYEIDGKTFFVMGGATSVDAHLRKEGVSWWAREMPSTEELERGFTNLEKHNFQVNYILTHCASNMILEKYFNFSEKDTLTSYFNHLEKLVTFDHWFFGHYHIDGVLDTTHTVLYNSIKKLY